MSYARRRTTRLSKNFTLQEFACHDGRGFRRQGTLPRKTHISAYAYLCREVLEELREQFGACKVYSGYRTPQHNAAIGGARGSVHVNEFQDADDVAADVGFKRGTPDDWYREAEEILKRKRGGKGGLGLYRSQRFLHVDTRDYASRWTG